MKIQDFGGNRVKKINLTQYGKQIFAEGEYFYYFYIATKNEKFTLSNLKSYTVIVYKCQNGCIQANDYCLEEGGVLIIDNKKLSCHVQADNVKLIVAGVEKNSVENKKIDKKNLDTVYKVTKPWGHELWLSGEHPDYCLKQIFIKQGNKTSLQYHRFKKETNVLFSGEATLHYKSNQNINNKDVQSNDISLTSIWPVSAIDIEPPVLHRLESTSDILLYEASTPQLDDVIRIEDDTNRMNGRISSEHRGF